MTTNMPPTSPAPPGPTDDTSVEENTHAPVDLAAAPPAAAPASASVQKSDQKGSKQLKCSFSGPLELLAGKSGGEVGVFSTTNIGDLEIHRFHTVKNENIKNNPQFGNQKVLVVAGVQAGADSFLLLCAVDTGGKPVPASFVAVEERQMGNLLISAEICCPVDEESVVRAAQEFIGRKITVRRQQSSRAAKKSPGAATVVATEAIVDTAKQHAGEIKVLKEEGKKAVKKAEEKGIAKGKEIARAAATKADGAQKKALKTEKGKCKTAEKELKDVTKLLKTAQKRVAELETQLQEPCKKCARTDSGAEGKENYAAIEARIMARVGALLGTVQAQAAAPPSSGCGSYTPQHHHPSSGPPQQWQGPNTYHPHPHQWGAYPYGGPPPSAGTYPPTAQR